MMVERQPQVPRPGTLSEDLRTTPANKQDLAARLVSLTLLEAQNAGPKTGLSAVVDIGFRNRQAVGHSETKNLDEHPALRL